MSQSRVQIENLLNTGETPGTGLARSLVANTRDNLLWIYDGVGSPVPLVGKRTYSVLLFYPGQHTTDELLLEVPVTETVRYAENFFESRGYLGTTALNSTFYDITINRDRQNYIGQAAFNPGQSAAVFTQQSDSAIAFPGDVISIYSPTLQDSTAADLSINLVGEIVP